MRPVARRGMRSALALAAVALLAGCAGQLVRGQATPGTGEPVDAAPDAFPVTGAGDSPVDQLARNALADLNTFWSGAYPEFYGEDFTPLENGYFSVDSEAIDESAYPDTGIGCAGSPTKPAEVAGNAYYDPSCDLIVYDRALLEELSTDYGRFLGPVVMAHEFGHAMQGRFGFAERAASRTRRRPTASPAPGPAGSPTGTPSTSRCARPSSTTSSGVSSCSATTSAATPTTARRTGPTSTGCRRSTRASTAGSARAGTTSGRTASTRRPPSPTTPTTSTRGTRPSTTSSSGPRRRCRRSGRRCSPPRTTRTSRRRSRGVRRHRARLRRASQDRDLGYCADDTTVYLDRTDLATPAYDEIGDFALTTALSLPYSLAVRDQAGLSTDDGAATRSAVCLTGWYEAQWYNNAFADVLPDVSSALATSTRPCSSCWSTACGPRSSRTRRRPGSSWSAPSGPASCRAATPATSAVDRRPTRSAVRAGV